LAKRQQRPPRRTQRAREIIERHATYTADGTLTVPPEAMRELLGEQGRRVTMSSVPSTQQNLMRTAGGAAVERGHSIGQLPIEVLRRIRDNSPILNPIHAARRTQVQRMSQKWSGRPGEVGWFVYHKDFYDPTIDPPDSIEPYIRAFEEMLLRPCPSYGINTTAALLVPLMEDYLTINRPCVEVMYLANAPGEMVGFRPIDGGIIWPTLAWLDVWRRDEGPSGGSKLAPQQMRELDALEVASYALEFDLFTADFVLVRNGMMERAYDRASGKLIVAPEITRTDVRFAGYPPSKVEEAMAAVVAATDAWTYNHNFFVHGFMAEQMFGISGDVNELDMQSFLAQLRDRTQGVSHAHEPLFLPMGPEGVVTSIPLRQHDKDMAFEGWYSLVANSTCAVYRMDPSTVNFKPWGGGSSGGLSEPNRNQEIALAKEEGLQSGLLHLCAEILEPLARRVHPDLRVRFEYGDYDPLKRAKVDEMRVRTDTTRNELRLETGRAPGGFYLPPEKYEIASDDEKRKHDANPWNWPDSQSFATAMDKILNPPAQAAPPAPGDAVDEDPNAPKELQGGDQRASSDELAKGVNTIFGERSTVYAVLVTDEHREQR